MMTLGRIYLYVNDIIKIGIFREKLLTSDVGHCIIRSEVKR